MYLLNACRAGNGLPYWCVMQRTRLTGGTGTAVAVGMVDSVGAVPRAPSSSGALAPAPEGLAAAGSLCCIAPSGAVLPADFTTLNCARQHQHVSMKRQHSSVARLANNAKSRCEVVPTLQTAQLALRFLPSVNSGATVAGGAVVSLSLTASVVTCGTLCRDAEPQTPFAEFRNAAVALHPEPRTASLSDGSVSMAHLHGSCRRRCSGLESAALVVHSNLVGSLQGSLVLHHLDLIVSLRRLLHLRTGINCSTQSLC